jgi:hypothetical protein
MQAADYTETMSVVAVANVTTTLSSTVSLCSGCGLYISSATTSVQADRTRTIVGTSAYTSVWSAYNEWSEGYRETFTGTATGNASGSTTLDSYSTSYTAAGMYGEDAAVICRVKDSTGGFAISALGGVAAPMFVSDGYYPNYVLPCLNSDMYGGIYAPSIPAQPMYSSASSSYNWSTNEQTNPTGGWSSSRSGEINASDWLNYYEGGIQAISSGWSYSIDISDNPAFCGSDVASIGCMDLLQYACQASGATMGSLSFSHSCGIASSATGSYYRSAPYVYDAIGFNIESQTWDVSVTTSHSMSVSIQPAAPSPEPEPEPEE